MDSEVSKNIIDLKTTGYDYGEYRRQSSQIARIKMGIRYELIHIFLKIGISKY